MEESQPKRKNQLVWLVVLAALVLLYWLFFIPPASKPHVTHVDDAADASRDPDDILVDLRDDLTDAQVAALQHDVGVTLTLVSSESRDERFYRAHVDPAREASILKALAARAEVEIAEPDAEMFIPEGEQVYAAHVDGRFEGFPDDPKYKYQWHMKQIGMPEAWKLASGNGTIVAVLDTGVAYESFGKYHQVEDLAGVQFVSPYDFVDNDKHANDDHGHGTHVTGTIAQATNNGIGVSGIALDVKIMPLKVLGGDGRGSVGGIADAIRYAADNGAKVINMSLGGPFSSRVMKKACEYAISKGTTIIAAAGNDGRNKVGYPAGYDGVVAVAATQFDESTTFYSNYGKLVDIAAPGGNTRVDQNKDGVPDGVLQNTIEVGNPTKSDYFPFMGTSMASPHVAGVAALVVGEGVTKPADVEKVLLESSRKPAAQKYDRDRYGAGILDAPAAVKLARKMASASASSDDSTPVRTGAEILLALLVAGAVAASTRKRGVTLGLGYLAGAVASVGGLVVLARLGLAIDGNPLVQSAMIPLVLLGMGYGSTHLRGPLAGVAAGAAAHLMFLAVTGAPVQWVPFDGVWLAVNALACLGLARAALRRVKLHVVTAPGQLYFGHMTVYPGAHKERLHGHNFTIFVDLELRDGSMAAMIDLGVARRALDALCEAWRERTLLAAKNPHFEIVRDDDELEFKLCGARYVLPRGDVLLLPIENTSVEGLAEHVVELLAKELRDPNIRALEVRIDELDGIGASHRRDL